MSEQVPKMRIENVNEVKKKAVGNQKNFSADVARLAPLLGMKGMDCSVVELKPGKKAWPYHLHYGMEELFIVLKGNGSIRFNNEQYPIKAGDVIFTPPGKDTAHQIINTSNDGLQYLAFSTVADVEFCYYPDSGKYGTYVMNEGVFEKGFIAHEKSEMDYFEGEDQ